MSAVLSVSRTTLHKFLSMPGAPVRGVDKLFDVVAVSAWLDARCNTPEKISVHAELRAQKQRLEIEEMEDARLLRRGELVKKSDIAPVIAAFNAALNRDLQQKFEQELPSKYRGKGTVECQQMNADALDWVLRRMKEGQWALNIPDLVPGPSMAAPTAPAGGT